MVTVPLIPSHLFLRARARGLPATGGTELPEAAIHAGRTDRRDSPPAGARGFGGATVHGLAPVATMKANTAPIRGASHVNGDEVLVPPSD